MHLLESILVIPLRPRAGMKNVNAPAAGQPPSAQEQLLVKITDGLKAHPALGAYKGYDEPDDRPRRGPRPPKEQLDLLDPRNAPERVLVP